MSGMSDEKLLMRLVAERQREAKQLREKNGDDCDVSAQLDREALHLREIKDRLFWANKVATGIRQLIS